MAGILRMQLSQVQNARQVQDYDHRDPGHPGHVQDHLCNVDCGPVALDHHHFLQPTEKEPVLIDKCLNNILQMRSHRFKFAKVPKLILE